MQDLSMCTVKCAFQFNFQSLFNMGCVYVFVCVFKLIKFRNYISECITVRHIEQPDSIAIILSFRVGTQVLTIKSAFTVTSASESYFESRPDTQLRLLSQAQLCLCFNDFKRVMQAYRAKGPYLRTTLERELHEEGEKFSLGMA